MAGLPVVRTGNVALDRFLEAVREYIETSNGGGNANAKDRVLRVSDIPAMLQLATAAVEKAPARTMRQDEVEKLANDLRTTRLFKSLTGPGSALDGVVDGMPRQVLADVRAASGRSQAGVTTEAIVNISENQALAAQVTTVESRLDGFDGAASIEEAYLALVDRVTGAEAQYTLKVTAGGAVAGFGLAATAPVDGTPSSAFMVSADKFAIVMPSYTGGLTNSPNVANMPFGVDASGVYINGTVRINAGGAAIQDGIEGPPGAPGATGATGPAGSTGATGAAGARGATRTVRTIAGSSWSDSEANSAISALGFSPVVRDEVTLRNSDTAPTYLETRYWAGSSWASIGVTINGNLLVSGSITSDKVGTNELTAVKVNTSGTVRAYGAYSVSSAIAVGTNKITAAIAGEGQGNPYYSTDFITGLFGQVPEGSVTCAGRWGVIGMHKGDSSSGATSASGGVFGYSIGGYGVYGYTTGAGSGVVAHSTGSGPALNVIGGMKWGAYTWASPSGSGTLYLRNDGSWASGPVGATGPTGPTGATGATGPAGSTSYNAGQLGGYNAADYLRYYSYAGGSPGTANFTLYVNVGGLNLRIPVVYP